MGTLNHKIAVALAAASLVGLVDVVAAGAASAAACTTNYVCLYHDKNYGGSQVNIINTSSTNAVVNLTSPIGFNDQMSSWQSRRTHYSRWYVNISGGGTAHCMNPNWNVSQVLSNENDTASSVRLYVDGTIC